MQENSNQCLEFLPLVLSCSWSFSCLPHGLSTAKRAHLNRLTSSAISFVFFHFYYFLLFTFYPSVITIFSVFYIFLFDTFRLTYLQVCNVYLCLLLLNASSPKKPCKCNNPSSFSLAKFGSLLGSLVMITLNLVLLVTLN